MSPAMTLDVDRAQASKAGEIGLTTLSWSSTASEHVNALGVSQPTRGNNAPKPAPKDRAVRRTFEAVRCRHRPIPKVLSCRGQNRRWQGKCPGPIIFVRFQAAACRLPTQRRGNRSAGPICSNSKTVACPQKSLVITTSVPIWRCHLPRSGRSFVFEPERHRPFVACRLRPGKTRIRAPKRMRAGCDLNLSPSNSPHPA